MTAINMFNKSGNALIQYFMLFVALQQQGVVCNYCNDIKRVTFITTYLNEHFESYLTLLEQCQQTFYDEMQRLDPSEECCKYKYLPVDFNEFLNSAISLKDVLLENIYGDGRPNVCYRHQLDDNTHNILDNFLQMTMIFQQNPSSFYIHPETCKSHPTLPIQSITALTECQQLKANFFTDFTRNYLPYRINKFTDDLNAIVEVKYAAISTILNKFVGSSKKTGYKIRNIVEDLISIPFNGETVQQLLSNAFSVINHNNNTGNQCDLMSLHESRRILNVMGLLDENGSELKSVLGALLKTKQKYYRSNEDYWRHQLNGAVIAVLHKFQWYATYLMNQKDMVRDKEPPKCAIEKLDTIRMDLRQLNVYLEKIHSPVDILNTVSIRTNDYYRNSIENIVEKVESLRADCDSYDLVAATASAATGQSKRVEYKVKPYKLTVNFIYLFNNVPV